MLNHTSKCKKQIFVSTFASNVQITLCNSLSLQGGSQTSSTSPCNGIVSHGVQIGVWVLPTTDAKTNTKQMHPQSLCVHVFIFTLRSLWVDAGDIHIWQTTVILIMGKTQRPPNLSPMSGYKWRRFWDLPCTFAVTVHLCWILISKNVLSYNLSWTWDYFVSKTMVDFETSP